MPNSNENQTQHRLTESHRERQTLSKIEVSTLQYVFQTLRVGLATRPHGEPRPSDVSCVPASRGVDKWRDDLFLVWNTGGQWLLLGEVRERILIEMIPQL